MSLASSLKKAVENPINKMNLKIGGFTYLFDLPIIILSLVLFLTIIHLYFNHQTKLNLLNKRKQRKIN